MESNARAILLIGDGMADRPVASLGGRTPLEAADTPNMNRLAREGESGLMDPIRPGIRVGSDTGHLAILGYDPQIYRPWPSRRQASAWMSRVAMSPSDATSPRWMRT